jgi:NADPH:quinone reductase-like Zn-dependent oxidoreductase
MGDGLRALTIMLAPDSRNSTTDGLVTDTVAAALWYTNPGHAEIREEALPQPGADEVRVRALCGAVSRGTESLVFAGRVPESEYTRMRAPFMGGAFPFPVKYGYATVGQVEAGPSELMGRAVFALYPHQHLFNLPVAAVVPLPDTVPPQRAVLAANMETALNAVWDASPGPADRIAVVGGGVVGALVAYLCGRLPGAHVTLVDVNPARAGLAQALGVSFGQPQVAPSDCDLVVHASGTAAGLATALSLAGVEATVLELSWYGAGEVAVPLGGAFHSRRLRLVSSQVGQVSPSRRSRWNYGRRLNAAVALLADLRLDALLAPPIAFGDLPQRLPDILAPGSGVLCQVIAYR